MSSVSPKELENVGKKVEETLRFLYEIYQLYKSGEYLKKERKWKLKSENKEDDIRVFNIKTKYSSNCHVSICTSLNTKSPKVAVEGYADDEILKLDETFESMETIHELEDSIKIPGFDGLCEVAVSKMKKIMTLKPRIFVHVNGIFELTSKTPFLGENTNDENEKREEDEEVEGEDDKEKKKKKKLKEDAEAYFTAYASIDWKSFEPNKEDSKRVRGKYFPSGGIFFYDENKEYTIMIEVIQFKLGGWVPGFVMSGMGGQFAESMVKEKKFLEAFKPKDYSEVGID